MTSRVEKKPGRRDRSGHPAGEHPELVVNAAILTALHGNGRAVSEIELDGLRGIHRSVPSLCMPRSTLLASGKRCVLRPLRAQAAEGRVPITLPFRNGHRRCTARRRAAMIYRGGISFSGERDAGLGQCSGMTPEALRFRCSGSGKRVTSGDGGDGPDTSRDDRGSRCLPHAEREARS